MSVRAAANYFVYTKSNQYTLRACYGKPNSIPA